ncbi:MAG: hypothetical protein ACP5QT_01400 [Brevinematia bacterium]
MFFRVIVNSIKKWWKNINLSIVSSIISAINPFFILLLFYSNLLISLNFEPLRKYPAQVMSFFLFMISIESFFPTTFTMITLQKNVMEKDHLSYKEFFSGFWRLTGRYFLPWLGLTLFFAISSILIIWTGGFYFQFIQNIVLKTAILVFVLFIFSIFIMTQYIFFPLYVYEEEKIKISNALKFAMEITLRNIHLLLPFFLFDTALFFTLMFLPYFNFFLATILYFGFVNYIRLYLYYEIIRKYTTQKKYATTSYTKTGNAPSPWLDLLKSKKDLLKK